MHWNASRGSRTTSPGCIAAPSVTRWPGIHSLTHSSVEVMPRAATLAAHPGILPFSMVCNLLYFDLLQKAGAGGNAVAILRIQP